MNISTDFIPPAIDDKGNVATLVCYDSMNHSQDLSLFRSKLGKIRHFEYDVICIFLCRIFFNVKSSLRTREICIGLLP